MKKVLCNIFVIFCFAMLQSYGKNSIENTEAFIVMNSFSDQISEH